jgi:Trk K+ transport system NAD-binding subunit
MAAMVDHFVVVGGNSLSYRLIVELTEHYDVPVVAIVPNTEHDHGPHILKYLGESAVKSVAAVDDESLLAADVGFARGIALLSGDDQDKIHGALRAQALNEGIRIVLAIDGAQLGQGVERLLRNCAAVSSASIAAPLFVNAALRRPNTVRVGGRSLAVAERHDSDPSDFLATVAEWADKTDTGSIRVLPDPPGPAAQWITAVSRTGLASGSRAVLAFAMEQQSLAARYSLWWRRLTAAWRVLVRLQMKIYFGIAAVVAVAAFTITMVLDRPFSWALYDTILGLAHVAVPDTYGQPSGTGGAWQRTAQVALALDGLFLAALVTAALIGSIRPRDAAPRSNARVRKHVIVVGLDDIGTHISLLLRNLNIPVVCVERDPAAPGVAVARDFNIPVIASPGRISARLHEARVQHSRAMVAAGGNDAANLDAALEARALAPDIRVVLRSFNDDLAEQVERAFTDTISRSVSYLTAPAFAAALMGREVLGTFLVYRHVVLIAAFTAGEGSTLVGRTLREIEIPGEMRVIAVQPRSATDFVWRPDHSRVLSVSDKYIVLITRAGLARHIAWASPFAHRGGEKGTSRQRRTPATDEFTVAIHLIEATDGPSVRAAVIAYLDQIGAEIVEDNEPVIGSWSWFAKARRLGRAAVDSQAGRQASNLAESVAWGPVRSRQADINLTNSQAVANLVQALSQCSSGLILSGSLLVVKTGDVPIVVMLSQEQVNALERRPALLSRPETILDDLQRVHAEQSADLDPPSLTG